MDPVSWAGLFAILTLTTLSGLLATAENAALELQLGVLDAGSSSAGNSVRRLDNLLNNRFRFWVSAHLGAALLIFAAAALAATAVADGLMALVPSRPGSVALALGALAGVHAVFARVVPRILAQRYPLPLAHRLALLLRVQYLVFLPAAKLFEKLLSASEQEAWKRPDPDDQAVLEAVEEGTRDGAIDEYDLAIITNVIELGNRVARQVMTPRPDIVAVSSQSSVREALTLAHARGLSRLPVYREDLDHVEGILHVREGVAALLHADAPSDLAHLTREPYFVPESKRVDELLREMRGSKAHLAIVVNEYGETAGLVTIEDLLEEIVGEIEDEFDEPEVEIEPVGVGEALVDAGALIVDLNQALELDLHSEDVDTVGGLVYNAFGHVPAAGETVTVDGAVISVLETQENRILRVRVRRLPEPVGDGG